MVNLGGPLGGRDDDDDACGFLHTWPFGDHLEPLLDHLGNCLGVKGVWKGGQERQQEPQTSARDPIQETVQARPEKAATQVHVFGSTALSALEKPRIRHSSDTAEPREAQDRSEREPREPRQPKEKPKRGEEGRERTKETTKSQERPKTGPREAQERPKRCPREAQERSSREA